MLIICPLLRRMINGVFHRNSGETPRLTIFQRKLLFSVINYAAFSYNVYLDLTWIFKLVLNS